MNTITHIYSTYIGLNAVLLHDQTEHITTNNPSAILSVRKVLKLLT